MIHIRPARLNDKGSTLKHWEDTILNSKSFNQISTFLNDEQKEKLLATGKEEFNLWGDTRKHQTIWSSMTPGEIILFYGDYKFHTKGKVETTFQNKVLAEELWPDYDPEKGPHLNIYSISGLEDIEIDYPSNRHYFQTAEGKPWTAKFIRRAIGFKEERVSSKFMAKVELGYEANSEDDNHTQKGLPRSTPVKRAEIYRELNKNNLSLADYKQIIQIDKKNYKAYYEMGVLLFLQNNMEEAIKLYFNSIEIKPTANAYNDRASCYRNLQQYDKAISDYNNAISLDDALAFVYNNLAAIYRINEDFEKAMSNYNIAIAKNPNYEIAYNNRGRLYFEQKNFTAAATDFDKAISLNSDYAPSYNNRGILHHKNKDYVSAITAFDKAISLDENYGKAYLNRGISKQMKRDEDGACADWEKASELGIELAKKYLINDCY